MCPEEGSGEALRAKPREIEEREFWEDPETAFLHL